VSFKSTLIRLLDRPGGRFFLGKVATTVVRQHGGDNIQIAYVDGFWTRRAGNDFFPDGQKFTYEHADFGAWKRQIEQYAADTKEYWLQHYVPQQGDVIVDVGAGRGEDTVTFSRAVGKTGRVIAIEAHPTSYAMLKSFCELNRLTNVIPLHLALMDKAGTVRIAESESSWMENAIEYHERPSGIPVRAVTFDEVFKEQGLTGITFFKMNIEGAERQALLGMEQAIPHIRQMAVACHDFRSDLGHGEHFRTRVFVEEFLTKRGFVVAFRADDPRDYVRDHVFGLRSSRNLSG
jgi:FkbM family methyltransferase